MLSCYRSGYQLLHGNNDRLLERVADALRRHRLELGDREVHDAALVGIERANLLRQAGVLGLAARNSAICFSSASLPLR